MDRMPIVLPGEADPLAAYPNLNHWFTAINVRPAVARMRARGAA
jgi:GST-like protein